LTKEVLHNTLKGPRKEVTVTGAGHAQGSRRHSLDIGAALSGRYDFKEKVLQLCKVKIS